MTACKFATCRLAIAIAPRILHYSASLFPVRVLNDRTLDTMPLLLLDPCPCLFLYWLGYSLEMKPAISGLLRLEFTSSFVLMEALARGRGGADRTFGSWCMVCPCCTLPLFGKYRYMCCTGRSSWSACLCTWQEGPIEKYHHLVTCPF